MKNRRNVETSKRQNERAPSAHEDFDVLTFGRLEVSHAPDLTRRIMGRLGYMRVPPRVVRRRRIAKWTGRCACIALLGVAVVLGMRAFEASPDARRPADITMPAAVTRDFQQQQSRVGSMIRLIQQSPLGLDAGSLDGLHEDPQGYEPIEQHDSHEIDEDVNRSAIAPVRWV